MRRAFYLAGRARSSVCRAKSPVRRAKSFARRAWHGHGWAWRPTVPVPAGQADAVPADTAGAGRWIVPWGHVGLAWSGKNESLAVIALWIGFPFVSELLNVPTSSPVLQLGRQGSRTRPNPLLYTYLHRHFRRVLAKALQCSTLRISTYQGAPPKT